ncbi:MAG: hypothetical protein QXE31_01475 [Candidatus Woesearchaeota archaeon]
MKKLKVKSQIFYLDFILGLTIFLVIIFLAFNFIYRDKIEENNLVIEAERISNILLSEGIPKNWNEDNLTTNISFLGIVSDKSLDIEKLRALSSLCLNNYTKVKNIFSVKYDFYVYFENLNQEIINLTIINSTDTFLCNYKKDVEDYITINRLLVYRHDDIAEVLNMKIVVYSS